MKTLTNIFNLLAGKKSTTMTPTSPIIAAPEPLDPVTNIPSPDVFVELEQPVSEKSEPQPEAEGTSLIDRFLSKDYFEAGYKIGFETKNADLYKQRIQLIKCDFRDVIQRIQSQLHERKHRIELDLIGLNGMHPQLTVKLQHQLKYLGTHIDELTVQLELSVSDEGMVMKAIHHFRLGFDQGMLDRINSEYFS